MIKSEDQEIYDLIFTVARSLVQSKIEWERHVGAAFFHTLNLWERARSDNTPSALISSTYEAAKGLQEYIQFQSDPELIQMVADLLEDYKGSKL